ncbi:MAG: RecQ family ATP-dependent DNA helicase [Candidatus Poribacteria bacterium]|nr:RecQ family ATP-dependent DNA helicase [Candidatus Poribacteria bacterium]MDE0506264.1 RecQ family ATP-dependent DNA helicase [Candidatus Poribacteria bacterium]
MGAEPDTTANLSDHCLSLDLEVGLESRRIHAFAAVRPDTGESRTYPDGRVSLARALTELDDFADGVDFLLGHNLIDHDLRNLRTANPNLRLLRLPAVDTLRLNPLAFPRNPYHHLVKHYQDGQLKRGRINDPDLDARLALELFDDQQKAFRAASPNLLTAWHWLTARVDGEGFNRFFASVRRSQKPAIGEAYAAMYALLNDKACRTHAREAIVNADKHAWELAYALAWISVSGGNSVMPPWVRCQFPEAGQLVRRLRDTSCADAGCGWCRERHDARKELSKWFHFTDFRPEPVDEDGRSMQRSIVESAMVNEHVLGILPTGSGKSICYQIPALSRYDKTGALTVVISPLVALMADQVAGLEKQGISCCVTVNGLLSMPERADALDRVRLGDAGIVLVAPEQLRSVSFRRVLKQREIGAWVLDEAHCLSKWGHDFRPDYRYVGRFVRERAGEQPIPPVLCLTATAKPDVKAEIVDYFRGELDIELKVFDGGTRRKNLEFEVMKTSDGEKYSHIHELLTGDLTGHDQGGAIVYCATRRQTEEIAAFLQEKRVEANYFHAGLTPETKKNVQERFIRGDLQVIAATNAFGMGIDKSDVRLVIHADIPGSLENYMQEAGRAGRDQQSARCVLLYTPEDVERQFGMAAYSRLTRREIQGVLRALRKLDRKKRQNGEVVATTGEILLEDEDKAFDRDSTTDDTRMRTAVAWLEEAVLLRREENYVRVFPSSLRVSSIEEARAKLETARFRADYHYQLETIVERLIEADADEGISTDELMASTGLTPKGVQDALNNLADLGVASNDTALTAFVHTGVERSSRKRFNEAAALEKALIDVLRETVPAMEKGESSVLHLRVATQRLKDEGHTYAPPERLWRIIRSIAADGRGEGGSGGSLAVRKLDPDSVRVTLLREWSDLGKTANLRRAGAERLLEHLVANLPPGSRGIDLLAETTLGKLLTEIKSDLVLTKQIKHPNKLMERALLWLHEQDVIQLNKGLAVFRPAMTIRLEPERRGFAQADFASLELHYDEQTMQIHVMAEYAERGLGSIADTLRLAMDYFKHPRDDFLRRWLPDREGEIARQTTPESWRTIVDSLRNPIQRRIVADDREQTNVLVLAGPGSGKTRVLVHRIAYLIRARRENPRGILALAYNRHAAVEIRRRLAELIGDDARGVMVFTCHALAMRLVGASFEGRANRMDDEGFREILRDAAALLRGEGLPSDEADEYRGRLLAGFRWILVDEYQDIGADQYELISALAGRTLSDEDDKLSLFAVGDDDQNIYAFNGSSVEFIRRFEADYGAKPTFLTDNYRSTAHIITTSNALIEPARQRMKTGHPIGIDRARAKEPPGGAWTDRDSVTHGQVQILSAGDNAVTQAQVVVAELKRLASLTQDWDWSKCAVVAREWSYLDPVRSLCELEEIPTQMANEDILNVWQLRETRRLVNWLRSRDSRLVASEDLNDWANNQPTSPWVELLQECISEYTLDNGDEESLAENFIERLAEWGREVRRRQRGLLLLTAHRAKGLEFDHVVVLDGNWDRVGYGEDADAPRRLYYVAMTRARYTLTLARFPGPHPLQDTLRDSPSVICHPMPIGLPPAPPELERRYRRLSLREVFLSFAGYKRPSDAVHRAIAALSPGDPLQVRAGAKRWEILDSNGLVVGQFAAGFKPLDRMRSTRAKVFAIASWDRERSEPQYRDRLLCDDWEVVVPELVFKPDS